MLLEELHGLLDESHVCSHSKGQPSRSRQHLLADARLTNVVAHVDAAERGSDWHVPRAKGGRDGPGVLLHGEVVSDLADHLDVRLGEVGFLHRAASDQLPSTPGHRKIATYLRELDRDLALVARLDRRAVAFELQRGRAARESCSVTS